MKLQDLSVEEVDDTTETEEEESSELEEDLNEALELLEHCANQFDALSRQYGRRKLSWLQAKEMEELAEEVKEFLMQWGMGPQQEDR